MPGYTSLFFPQLYVQSIGTIVSHLYPRKKAHEQESYQKPGNCLPFDHIVKIKNSMQSPRPG